MVNIRTLNDVFFEVVGREHPRAMLRRGDASWQAISAAQIQAWVYATARHLQNLGIRKGDRVVLLSENRPEWAIADFACLLLGVVTVPIYATLTAEQSLYMLQHSGARVAFVSTRAQYDKIAPLLEVTKLERLITMDSIPGTHDAVYMHAFLKDAKPEPDPKIEAMGRAIEPDDIATIIYTSGTTGTPKGVMLTHRNIASNLCMSIPMFDLGAPGEELAVSFLPLSHITARHLDYFLLYAGATIAYCPSFDDLPVALRETKPTIFVAVPRVYEKIHNGVLHKATGVKKTLVDWALNIGRSERQTILENQQPSALRWKIANKLVFSKIRTAMGGRARIFISGGAPLGRELGEWFADIGICILEGYGLTETSPLIALNNPAEHRLGSVGKIVGNVEARIASDGELLVRGPNVFKGYWHMPDETAAAFDDGWFKTGDIGSIDPDGYLSITDRKKDLIKTSGGKFIAPQPIESTLKANLLVGEAAVIGEKRRFPSVLIFPNFPMLEDWAKGRGLKFSSHRTLVNLPEVQSLYEEIVDGVNANLARYEKLKKVAVIAHEPTIAEGTLTPSMKLRRRKLEERYHKEIEGIYAGSESPSHVTGVHARH